MTNPIKAITRAITPPGHPGSPGFSDTPPPLAPEASTPAPKPKRKGIQESFLSGIAAGGLGGYGGRSGGGKTLLGQ